MYQAVRKIPRGKVKTYKEIARIIGHPRACRAVGNVLNKTPGACPVKFSELYGACPAFPQKGGVPCHRVVRTDGSIGGYAHGTKKKTALLRREGVEIKKGNVIFKY